MKQHHPRADGASGIATQRQLRATSALIVALSLCATLSPAKAPPTTPTTPRPDGSLTAPAPALELDAPALGRGHKAEIEERIKRKREQIKEKQERLAALKSEPASPSTSASMKKADAAITALTQALERAKKQLSKEKPLFSKRRSEAQKSTKRRWGKHFGSAPVDAELLKHARRMAILERIHHVAVTEKRYELAGRAAVAIAAEEYRHDEVHRLVMAGVKLPAPVATPASSGVTASEDDAPAAEEKPAKGKDKPLRAQPATGPQPAGPASAPVTAPAKEGSK